MNILPLPILILIICELCFLIVFLLSEHFYKSEPEMSSDPPSTS